MSTSQCMSRMAGASQGHALRSFSNTDKNPRKYNYERKLVPSLKGYENTLPCSLDTYLEEEAASKLPPHLQLKYLPKKLRNIVEKKRALKSIENESSNFKDLLTSVSRLCSRIDVLTDHMKMFPKDSRAKLNMIRAKIKRDKHFRFLKRKDFTLYQELKQKYNLKEIEVSGERLKKEE